MSSYQKIYMDDIRDKNYLRYAGYEYTSNEVEKALFSDQNVNLIQLKCKQLLKGVEPSGKDIIIQKPTIYDILSTVWMDYKRKNIGDIYTIFTIPLSDKTSAFNSIVDQTIELITNYVRVDYGMREQNSKLSIWTTVLGDFNQHGLRPHDVIKIQEKRPTPMQFNMRY